MVPRPRFEKTKLFIVNLIEVAEELDDVSVGVGVIDEHVVPDAVTPRTPDKPDTTGGERVTRCQ